MMFRVCVFLCMLWAIEALGDINPPSYLVGYVTGDTSIKLAWEVKSSSNENVFELRWKINSNESSMVLPGSTGTITLKNLRVYTQYLFRVRRGLVNGTWGAFTRYTRVWTPEGVPTAPPANVTAYNTSSVSIMVFWSQVPKPHRNGHVLGYKVCYKRADTNDSVLYCIAVYALGIELGGLKSYTPYWITVLSYTNKGEGPTSEPLLVWTDEFVPTAAPKVRSLTSNVTAIKVTWDPIPQEHVNGILRGYYVIYWQRPRTSSDNHVIQVNQSTLSVVIAGLERNTSYGVRLAGLTKVRGWIRNGVLSRTHNVTTKYGLTAPQNVKAFSPCSSCLRVSWDPVYVPITENAITGYQVIYRDASGKMYTKFLGPKKSTANLKNLNKFSTYTVTVSAVTDGGLGEISKPVTFTTLEDVPSRAPVSLQVQSTGPRSILIKWSPVPEQYVHGILRGYHVYYKTGTSKMRRSASQVGVIKAMSVNMSSQSLEITGLEPFTSYDVWVSAFTDMGSGPSSRTVTVTTDEDVPSRAPRIMKLLAKTSDSVFIQWQTIPQRHVKGILQGYRVHYSEEDTSYPVIKNVITVNASVTRATLNRMKPLTRYRVWIAGFTAKGAGPSSEKEFVSTPQAVPNSPQGVQVFIKTPKSVVITWRSHTGFTGRVTRYTVKWLQVGNPADSNVDGHKIVNAGSPYRRETQVGGLKPFTMYSFMVREEAGQDNWSKFSAPVDIIMPEDVPSPPREISVKFMQGTRLVLQWRKPEETNGIIKKYVLHFSDTNGVVKTYTTHFNVDKEYLTYEVSLPDAESEFKIKVQAYNSLPGRMSEEITVQHLPSIDISEARNPDPSKSKSKSKLIWIVGGLVGAILLLVFITAFVLIRRDSRRSKEPIRKLSIISTSAPPSRPIPVKELAEHCVRFHANNNALFNDEYKCLGRLTWKSSWEASHTGLNRPKNRYCNIVAYDHSRVILRSVTNTPGSDYINANYVDGYSDPAKYIATQGPLKNTMDDFWRMIWEKNVKTIVMIEEQGKENEPTCERYWHETEPAEYGHVTVSLLNSCIMTDWTVREFIIWSTDQECTEKRDIFQYHFTSWPDHYVPRDTAAFLMFHHKLKSALSVDPGPIVVHCSAGVGRTGSFIAIDSLMEQMETEKAVDVYGFVARMRKQRNYMVQTQEQYWFIHDVLRDASICGVTTIPSNDLGSSLLCVTGDEPEIVEKRTREFENLQVYPADSPFFSDALVRENVVKNRSPERLPFDQNRVRLKTIPDEPGSDYINASFIDSYNEGKLYIATQAPFASTVDDFWRMAWEQRSTIVVMLSNISENEMEHDTRYWPEEGWAKYGKLRVTKIDEERLEDHTQRVFKLRRQGCDESRLLYHFQYRRWGETGLPQAQSLVYLHQQVHKVQSGEQHHGPIIVHCSNGDGRTGVFICLCLSIERLETEDNVDVFQTVRWLRSQRAGLVTNAEQYNFCYELIKSYLAWRTINTIQNDYT